AEPKRRRRARTGGGAPVVRRTRLGRPAPRRGCRVRRVAPGVAEPGRRPAAGGAAVAAVVAAGRPEALLPPPAPPARGDARIPPHLHKGTGRRRSAPPGWPAPWWKPWKPHGPRPAEAARAAPAGPLFPLFQGVLACSVACSEQAVGRCQRPP